MSNITTSEAIKTFMQSADQSAMVAALGINFNDTNVAFIRANGHDDSGDGSRFNPFRNWQPAIDAGFKSFDFGSGTFLDINATLPTTGSYYIIGAGNTNIPTVTIAVGGGTNIQDIGHGSFYATGMNVPSGANGQVNGGNWGTLLGTATGSDNAGNITLTNGAYCTSVESNSVDGAAGAIQVLNGSWVTSVITAKTSGMGTDGTLTVRGGSYIDATIDVGAIIVSGAIIADVFYTNTYP